MRWLLRLVLFRVLGSRVMLGLAVVAWLRSILRRSHEASGRARDEDVIRQPGRTQP